MVFLSSPSSPFISSSTRLLPHSVTADAAQSGSIIIPSSPSTENSTLANRATFPHIIRSIHNLPTEFQETEDTVSQEHWNKMRQGTSKCFLPYAALRGSKHSCIIHFFFFTCNALMVSTCNSQHFATRIQEKESRRDWQGQYHKTFSKIYCFIWNTGQVKEMCCSCTMSQCFLEMDLCVKWIVSKVKPAYLNVYIINSTTLNKYIQILRRCDVSYENHLM